MLTPERGHYVEVLGLRTFYLQAGAGQPVVLLHGSSPGACSLIHWKHNLDALVEAGFAVYAYDQPGFGYSDNPTDYSMDATVAHARAFMAAFNLTGCHLVGSSLGSEIAVRVALADPGVGRLVLAAASTIAPLGSPASAERAQHHGRELREFVPGLENMRRLSLGTLYNPALVTQELVQARHEMSIGKNYEAQTRRREVPRPPPIHDALGELRSKTLVVWGKNDRGAMPERALLLFDLIPDAELHLFDQAAHWVQWDQAHRFNRVVVDFLSDAGR